MAFADPGGEHVHVLRNEGAIETKTIAVQIISAGAGRRIEVADLGTTIFNGLNIAAITLPRIEPGNICEVNR